MMHKLKDDATLLESLLELWADAGRPATGIPKAILIEFDMLKTPVRYLKKESSLYLFARLIFNLTGGKQELPVPKEKLQLVIPLIDPNMKAIVPENMVRFIYHVPVETLNMHRETGLLSFAWDERGYKYDWDQVRALFGDAGG